MQKEFTTSELVKLYKRGLRRELTLLILSVLAITVIAVLAINASDDMRHLATIFLPALVPVVFGGAALLALSVKAARTLLVTQTVEDGEEIELNLLNPLARILSEISKAETAAPAAVVSVKRALTMMVDYCRDMDLDDVMNELDQIVTRILIPATQSGLSSTEKSFLVQRLQQVLNVVQADEIERYRNLFREWQDDGSRAHILDLG